jgi:hypothetical protein
MPTLKYVVFQIRDDKHRDKESRATRVSLETKTDKHCQDIKKLLQNYMHDEDDESYYIGVGTLKVMSRAEYRASEHHQRCCQYIKVTNSVYDRLLDFRFVYQHEALSWLRDPPSMRFSLA